jgi:hypothetical protein
MDTLIYCLNVLKIKKDSEFYRNAAKLAENIAIESEHEWTSATEIIANASPGYTFSQSQLADFLTLAANGIEEKRTGSEIIVFKMYRDIMENYNRFGDSLKSNYPEIIVDVISVINQGIDTKGTKVSIIGLERYYQSRKQQAVMRAEEKENPLTAATPSTTTTTAQAVAIHKEKILPPRNDLVEILTQITKRNRQEIQQSLTRLQESDLKRISNLCHNYSKLQHYSSKLITKEEFKNEIQKEIGIELRPYQLARAANSIRKVQIYIENILDNKFILDASHGINHIKHNLEYGYQLMNLLERIRRIRQRTS